MTIEFEKEYDKDLGINYEEIADKVINAALDYEECPYEAEVSLTLVDNNRIHDINKEFRDRDRPTDVLSFPMLSYEAPGDFSFLSDENEDDFNPDTGEVMLGDIIISVDKVKEQALEYGHSEKREFAFLITHSMLHLFGYDHMEPDEAAVMEEHQRKILDALGITR